jgi:site-specific DNA-cytosine methylase
MGADEVGAPHRRKRIWILACDADRDGESALPVDDETSRMRENASDATSDRRESRRAECQGQQGTTCAIVSRSELADAESQRGRSGLCEDQAVGDRDQPSDSGRDVPDAEFAGLEGYAGDGTNRREPGRDIQEQDGSASAADLPSGTTAGDWWRIEPAIRRMADGMADELDQHGSASAGYAGRVATGVPARVQKLKAIGNGQVPLCAATAFAVLKSWIDEDEETERKEQS